MFALIKNGYYHRPYCDCIRAGDEYTVSNDKSISQLGKMGYLPCRYCSKFLRQYYAEEKEIKEFCFEHALRYKLLGEALLINTYYSSWKVAVDYQSFHEKNALVLMHENDQMYIMCDRDQGNIYRKYHFQNDVHCNTILGYLQYIIEHDKYREGVNTQWRKYSRKTEYQRKKYRKDRSKDIDRMSIRVYNLLEELKVENEYKNCVGEG